MIGIKVVNIGSEEEPNLRAMITTDQIRRNSSNRRRVVHQNGGRKFIEAVADIDDARLFFHDVARAAFLLGMAHERANPGAYAIPDDE